MRSSRRSRPTPRCPRRRSWRARTCRAVRSWWPTPSVRPPRGPCARTWPRACPRTWCPPCTWRWTRCRSPRTARSTASCCPRPPRARAPRPVRRARLRSSCCARCSARCSGWPRPRVRTTRSSNSAATRCSPPVSPAGSGRRSAPICRSARSSTLRPRPPSRPWSRTPGRPGPLRRRPCARTCFPSPPPSSGSGSSRSWRRAVPRTTSPSPSA